MRHFRWRERVTRPLLAVSGVLASSLVLSRSEKLGKNCDDNGIAPKHGESERPKISRPFTGSSLFALASLRTGVFSTSITSCETQKTFHKKPDKLPFYTAEQVAQRNGKDSKEIWVTFADKVHDITDFVNQHKGGSFILNAAGGAIDEFWGYWAYHTHIKETMDILERHHIGYLVEKPDESLSQKLEAHYSGEPQRDSRQKSLTLFPWCSETPPELQNSLYTDDAVFYVRNHAPVPELSAENHVIRLECCPMETQKEPFETEIDLQHLGQQFPLVEIASAMQCAGNRAVDLQNISPTAFALTPFRDLDRGMIGNSVWGGYSLRSLLLDRFPWLSRLSDEEASTYHVEFEGVDDYFTSTPLSRVLDPSADAILAVTMNGKDLTPDHGFPVRAFLPGIAGARNVKWLHTIRIQPEESQSCFTQVYYKDPHGKAIQEMPMQSFLTTKEQLHDGQWQVKGVAWGGGSGVGVSRIQVTTDNGDWVNVPLQHWRVGPRASREWSWVTFEIILPSQSGVFTCRIVDGQRKMQPEALWYPKGYLSNPWHTL